MEAAALAHDLGHPPFGHAAEQELDRLAASEGLADGFEGNPQTFRILTAISAHRPRAYRGLDLTKATLNAVMKYPWLRDSRSGTPRHAKFGAYRSESADFKWARQGQAEGRSLEAAVMDHADDIAYSVHDLEDFFKAGLIPLHLLLPGPGVPGEADEFELVITRWKERKPELAGLIDGSIDVLQNQLESMVAEFGNRYTGSFEERCHVRRATSLLIQRYLQAARIGGPGEKPVEVDPRMRIEIKFLQELVWQYVIHNPRLATQQAGQRVIVGRLFETYLRACNKEDWQILPTAFHGDFVEIQEAATGSDERHHGCVRLAIDIISSFTDLEASTMYRRLTGVAPGSVTELLHS